MLHHDFSNTYTVAQNPRHPTPLVTWIFLQTGLRRLAEEAGAPHADGVPESSNPNVRTLLKARIGFGCTELYNHLGTIRVHFYSVFRPPHYYYGASCLQKSESSEPAALWPGQNLPRMVMLRWNIESIHDLPREPNTP